MKKKLSEYLESLLVALSIISIGNMTKAAQIDTILYSWQRIWETTSVWTVLDYEINHQYKDITFVNGYTYTQSRQDVISLLDSIGRIFLKYSTQEF